MNSNEFHIMRRSVVSFHEFIFVLNEILFNHHGILLLFSLFQWIWFHKTLFVFVLQIIYVTMNLMVFHMFVLSILCFMHVCFSLLKQRLCYFVVIFVCLFECCFFFEHCADVSGFNVFFMIRVLWWMQCVWL